MLVIMNVVDYVLLLSHLLLWKISCQQRNCLQRDIFSGLSPRLVKCLWPVFFNGGNWAPKLIIWVMVCNAIGKGNGGGSQHCPTCCHEKRTWNHKMLVPWRVQQISGVRSFEIFHCKHVKESLSWIVATRWLDDDALPDCLPCLPGDHFLRFVGRVSEKWWY